MTFSTKPKDSNALPETEALPSYVNLGHTCACCGGQTNEGSSGSTSPISITSRGFLPAYVSQVIPEVYRPEVLKTIEEKIDELNLELRKLSLDIWDHPEVGYEEYYAHDTLTAFIAARGFTVIKHYLGLETAWRAEFSLGEGGRVIGINSEMDALPNIGHACGHNLIAVSGVAVAIAIKEAMIAHSVSGKVVLLGTPAEESGGGKIKLLERGGYKEMDACIMSHPGPGAPNGAIISSWVSLQNLEVEFFGHSAHAAFCPWEAQNALDAAFLTYSSISVLRQQVKPTHRVHGIVTGKGWEPNVIPDYAKMRWIIRAPTWTELEVLRKRVTACFEAAALATSCKVKVEIGLAYYDVRENNILAEEFAKIAETRYGMGVTSDDLQASTDFGNVSYELPSIQPAYSVPVQPNGSNHTPQFAQSARTPEAHKACMTVSKVLAMTGFRVLDDADFCQRMKKAFDENRMPTKL